MKGATVIIRLETRDFHAWRAAHDRAELRGAQGVRLYRDVDAPNQVVAVIEWDDADCARAFVGDDQTKAMMFEAGVVGVPEIQFVREV